MTKEKFLNLEIGKTFNIGNQKFKVLASTPSCDECALKKFGCGVYLYYQLRPSCCRLARNDGMNVIFVEVE